MASNRSSFPNFSDNYDDSESMSNTQPDNSGVHRTVDHDGNGMDLEIDLYAQPELGHGSHTLYSTNHHAGPQLNMSRMEVYPTNFLSPGLSIPEGSDYGWFSDSSFSGANYMEGLGSARNTGMTYGGYQGRGLNTMNFENNNNVLHPTILPHSSFTNSNAHAVYGMQPTISVATPNYGHADVYAQSPNFGHNFDPMLDPASAIRTSTKPSTPLRHGHDADYKYATPAPKLPKKKASASASKRREKTQGRVYRISYASHASHRYTCHPCRFSTDVKRDFARHLETGKHKRKTQ